MSLANHLTRIDSTLRDTAGRTTPEQRRAAFDDAVTRYSQHKPRRVVADVVMAASNVLPALTGWVDGWSAVASIETPIGQRPPSLVAADRFDVTATPTGEVVSLLDGLAIGTSVRVTFTAYHVCNDTQDTLPQADAEAIACWAAAILGDQIAASYSDASAPTIQADRVDQSSPAREWAKRARDWRDRYYSLIGVDPAKADAACAVVNLDLADSRGWPRQTHWRNR